MKKLVKLFISIIVPVLTGFAGSVFTGMSVNTWYKEIRKPFFNPPDWIFAPVWILLYILMGIAFFGVWSRNSGGLKKGVFLLYFSQLLFNFLWTVFFFGLRNPLIAFLDIVVLWVLILFLVINFYKVFKVSAFLLLPYLLWVSFALILNFAIIILNFS